MIKCEFSDKAAIAFQLVVADLLFPKVYANPKMIEELPDEILELFCFSERIDEVMPRNNVSDNDRRTIARTIYNLKDKADKVEIKKDGTRIETWYPKKKAKR